MKDYCIHIQELKKITDTMEIRIWSEHGEPDGWVNVHCNRCNNIFETSLLADYIQFSGLRK